MHYTPAVTQKTRCFAIAACLGFLGCGSHDTPKTVVSVPTSSPCVGVDTPIGKAKALVAEGKLRRAQTLLGDAPAACSEEATALRASISHLVEIGPRDRAGAEALMEKAIATRSKDEVAARRDLDIARTVLEREIALKTEIYTVPTATIADIRGKWMVLDGALFDVETQRMVVVPTGNVTIVGTTALVAQRNESDEVTLAMVDLVRGELLETNKLADPNFVVFDNEKALVYESPENTLVVFDFDKRERTIVATGRPIVHDWVRGSYTGDDRGLWTSGAELAWITSGPGGDAFHVRDRRSSETTVTRGGPTIASATIDATRIAIGWGDAKIDVFDRAGKKVFGFDRTPAEAIGVKGDVVAWTDNTTVRSRDKSGRTGSAPLAETGCSAPRILRPSSVAKVATIAESGDITCEVAYNLAAHTSEQTGGETPGDAWSQSQTDMALCNKVGGTDCEVDGGMGALVRHGKESMVLVENDALIVEEDGSVKFRSKATCVAGSMWFDATRFACVVKDRVQIWSRATGDSMLVGPQPGPRVIGGVAPFSSREQAKEAIRCKLGARLYPLDLCEDVAAEAGFIPRS